MATQIEDPAVAAYELLAPFYDLYTHDYAHEELLGSIEGIALEHGLGGRGLLAVGCGTGKSFLPTPGRGGGGRGAGPAARTPTSSWPTRANCPRSARSTSRSRSTTRSTTC